MHAYVRMEADQTDSIAVCATKREWREVVTLIKYMLDYDPKNDALALLLRELDGLGIA